MLNWFQQAMTLVRFCQDMSSLSITTLSQFNPLFNLGTPTCSESAMSFEMSAAIKASFSLKAGLVKSAVNAASALGGPVTRGKCQR